MAITLELSTEQERRLREGAANADAAAMRRVLLQAIDSTIERLLRLSAKAAFTPDKATRRHQSPDQPTLKELLLAKSPRAEIPVPSRRLWRRRTPEAFE